MLLPPACSRPPDCESEFVKQNYICTGVRRFAMLVRLPLSVQSLMHQPVAKHHAPDHIFPVKAQ